MSQAYLRDLNFQIQLEQMMLNQWGESKPREQSKKFELTTSYKKFELPSPEDLINIKKETQNKQLARQEQIQLYLEKEKRPVVINGVEYKYNSIPEPNLDDIQPYKDSVNDLQNDINYYENEINKAKLNIEQSKDKIQQYNLDLNNLTQNKEIIRIDYETKLKKLQEEKQKYIDAGDKTGESQIDDLIKDLEKERKNVKKEIKQINSDIEIITN
jgi:chromosome segregation ATPase